MNRPQRGFTLVELLIVLTVLGILMTIGVLGTSGYVKMTNDKSRETDTRQWAATFDIYKSRFSVYPSMPVNAATPTVACLGKFASSSNRCGQYGNGSASYIDTTSDSIIAEIQKVGKAPTNAGAKIDNLFAGPLLYITQNVDTAPVTVTANFVNFFQQSCPEGFNNVTATPPFDSLKATQTGNPTLVCKLTQSFTYSPS